MSANLTQLLVGGEAQRRPTVLDELKAILAGGRDLTDDDLRAVAARCGIPEATVHGIVTFYGDLMHPRGTRHIAVCTGTACWAADPPGEEADDDFPVILITGGRLEHHNAGTMTRRTGNLALLASDTLEIHPDDAIGDSADVNTSCPVYKVVAVSVRGAHAEPSRGAPRPPSR